MTATIANAIMPLYTEPVFADYRVNWSELVDFPVPSSGTFAIGIPLSIHDLLPPGRYVVSIKLRIVGMTGANTSCAVCRLIITSNLLGSYTNILDSTVTDSSAFCSVIPTYVLDTSTNQLRSGLGPAHLPDDPPIPDTLPGAMVSTPPMSLFNIASISNSPFTTVFSLDVLPVTPQPGDPDNLLVVEGDLTNEAACKLEVLITFSRFSTYAVDETLLPSYVRV